MMIEVNLDAVFVLWWKCRLPFSCKCYGQNVLLVYRLRSSSILIMKGLDIPVLIPDSHDGIWN